MSQPPQSGALAANKPKRRFIPKRAPPKKEVKTDPEEEEEQGINVEKERELLQRFHEQSLRVRPKNEKKEKPVQVSFGRESQSSTTYWAPRGPNGSGFNPVIQEEKEYQSPFDIYGHYPISLPLRQPSSEDPAILNQHEFGDGLEESTYDENATPAADELDLKEENRATSMLFLHLPPTLPISKQPAGQQVNNNSGAPPGGARNTENPCSLSELPAGFMGKMLVYRSGAIKLKLGETLYDVSTGMNCDFAQDVVAINTTEKTCCTIGELNKRAVVTPDIDSVLKSLEDL